MGLPYVPSICLEIKLVTKERKDDQSDDKIWRKKKLFNFTMLLLPDVLVCLLCLTILTGSLFHFQIHSKGRSVQLWFLTRMIMMENWTNLSFSQFSLFVVWWYHKRCSVWSSLVGIDSWHWIDCHYPEHSLYSPHWGELPLHENRRKAWAECFKAGSAAAHRDTR